MNRELTAEKNHTYPAALRPLNRLKDSKLDSSKREPKSENKTVALDSPLKVPSCLIEDFHNSKLQALASLLQAISLFLFR
jgi:hypothetical protein